jgi:hypothetical protein
MMYWTLSPEPAVVTVCCGVLCRFPAAAGLGAQPLDGIGDVACWPIIASPSFCVHRDAR